MFMRSTICVFSTLLVSYVSGAVLSSRAPVSSLSSAAAERIARRAPGDVITKCTVPGTVALTFDDGPWTSLDTIVNALNEAGAKGTFYFNGNNMGCIYNENLSSMALRAYQAGHQIASHTWRHSHLASLSPAEVEVEFTRSEQAIQKITGAVPAFVRPPYGEYNQAVQDVAREHGVTITNWDFDSGDTSSTSVSAAQLMEAYRGVIAAHPESILTLNHEIPPATIEVLPQVIAELQAAGYTLVTVAECLELDPYLSVGEPSPRDETWTC